MEMKREGLSTNGHQQADGLRQKDGAEVSAEARGGPALRTARGAAQPSGNTQAVLARPDEGQRVEGPGAAARATAAWLPGAIRF
jgi:hypothetical protein